jgi:uncharacterized membrane protein YeaQ/YmgE (transglycosylase-associated protein family)
MSWFDLVLVLGFSALTALGVQRRLMGLVVGLGGLLVFRPLLIVLSGNAYLALLFALVAGLLLGLISRFFLVRRVGTGRLYQILGGLGGAFLGVIMVLALVTSFPIGHNINNQIIYPSTSLPASLTNAVRQSRLVNVGRDILLYPLLEAEPRFASGTGSIYKSLHQFFVVGQPWERSEN